MGPALPRVPLLDLAWTRRSVQLLLESSAHLHPLDLAWTDLAKVEVALLSELGFKHQVSTAGGGGGGGGRRGRGVHEVPGCPEDRKQDGGRPGGRGVVSRRWGGGGGGGQ